MQRIDCDVLVVGGGGAGLMAAYEASNNGVRVAVVNKGKVQRTGATVMAPGAAAAVDDRWKSEGDSKELHIADTLKGGAFLNDEEKVTILAERAPELLLQLERMGAIFQRDETGATYLLRTDGGHTYPRSLYLEDRTGREIVKALVSGLRKNHVPLYENIMITRLLKHGDAVSGAVGVHLHTGEPVLFECSSVILATGGAGAMYANTDNPIDLTGDGYALALRAGATLRDMEFVQFFPIGFLFPMALRGIVAGALYYCRLLNADGERFMERYDRERLELSTRDRVARAIMQEVREGRGTPLGGVYLDLTTQEPGFLDRMTPGLCATYRNIGIDPAAQMIEVAPTCHFFMGGIDCDNTWESSVPGLFTAGETAGGMHGGNRLSQNALAEIIVSGSIAGRHAAERAAKTKRERIDPVASAEEKAFLNSLLAVDNGLAPSAIRAGLKTAMWDGAGITRSRTSLEKALGALEDLESLPVYIPEKDRYMNRGLTETLENRNLLLAARCVVTAALVRRESRAAHYREDYPETDDAGYRKTILITCHERTLFAAERPLAENRVQPEV